MKDLDLRKLEIRRALEQKAALTNKCLRDAQKRASKEQLRLVKKRKSLKIQSLISELKEKIRQKDLKRSLQFAKFGI